MNIQNVAGLGKTIEIGIKKVKEMLPVANQAYREKCPVSEIKLALQCGGSDAWSGITANPALGKACDILVSQGRHWCISRNTRNLWSGTSIDKRSWIKRLVKN